MPKQTGLVGLPKGASTAAQVTASAAGDDHQSLDVRPLSVDSGLTKTIDAAQLPASGEFNTSLAYTTIPINARRVTFVHEYTRHASATTGQAKCRILWKFSDTVTDVAQGFIDQSNLTVSEPKVSAKGYCLDVSGPQYTTATPGRKQWTFEIPAGAIGVRMILAEMGDTTNRGTVSQWVAFSEVM